MPVPTTRTKENSTIKINTEICNGCGLCVSVCKDFSLILFNNKAVADEKSILGCIGCGHCMAICPKGAIEITGREISPEDLFQLPDKSSATTYDQLLSLLQHRRSIREFTQQEITPEVIEKIITAAATAPMGLPPSDVNVLIINGKEKTGAFVKDFSNYLKGLRYMSSKLFLALMRPFWGKANDEFFREFIRPVFNFYIDDMEKGKNYITYDAPLLIYFYGSPYSDPADPVVAATYAMIAGESLGLGSCMLGAIHPFIQNGKRARRFRESHNIKYKSREGLFVAFGYSAVKYSKGIKRTFASVEAI
ncbi:MAG: nitroreductase family protein [Bacteroidales bacterium]|nr:nitroreductase family protein [Bacteroidales bacterium]MDD2426296.1 nitroreductase family protein [Bacteroidales bacterium]MDD3990378.1 nitroreductase family protein [Bacteroidales bacterium]